MPYRIVMLSLLLLVVPQTSAQVAEQDEVETLRKHPTATQETRRSDAQRAVDLIVQQTNQFRAEHGRDALQADPDLAEAAQSFAEYMARTNRYGHNADGKTPAQRVRQAGYAYCVVAENIAYQYDSTGFTTRGLADAFVDGWQQSPEHRRNMLDRDVTEIGVGLAQSEDTGYWYAVQNFGRPRSMRIEFEIANESGVTVNYTIADRSFTLPPRYSRTHQICRPSQVTFQLPGSEGGRTLTEQPTTGDKYVITGQRGQVQVEESHSQSQGKEPRP